jgi:regulator of cell morphogenesis and NO signaling
MIVNTTRFVGDIAAEYPASITLFKDAGIDYCCGGRRTLKEACDSANVSLEKMVRALETVQTSRLESGASDNWSDKTISDLIDYLLEKHHVFTKKQLVLLVELSRKTKKVHGAQRAELEEVNRIIEEAALELTDHMAKEEHIAFPYLKSLEKAVRDGRALDVPFPFEVFQNHPQRVLMADHEITGSQMRELRLITSGFVPPEGACPTYRALYQGLSDLEEDLHRHIHLENNVLFPKAERLANRK